MSGGPIFENLNGSLGADRLQAFTEAHGKLQAMAFFLVLTTGTVPQAGYSDESLQAMRSDAEDVRSAANELANFTQRLAGDWKAQREENQ